MRPKKNQKLQLKIEDLAYGGNGVARLDDFVVFVPESYPGDIIEAIPYKIRGNYAEARLTSLITPSPDRITPICEHFDICGGCKWQNLNYAIQLKYKENQVKDALVHLGKFTHPPVAGIIPADPNYFYRNKMEYSFHPDLDGRLLLGLHVSGKFQEIFQLQRCHLQSELSNQIVEFVRRQAIELELPPYNVITHEGFLRYLVVRDAKFTGDILVNFVTGQGPSDKLRIISKNLSQAYPQIKSISHTINAEKANVARGNLSEILFGSEYIYEKLHDKIFRISSNSFFQTNSYQARRLYDLALEMARPDKSDLMLDLYTGTGTIAIYMSDYVAEVKGVETIQSAVADAIANAEINSVSNCNFISANVEDYLDNIAETEKINLVVLDPPRAGCHPHTVKSLLRLKPARLVYISCNPATLARDLNLLCANTYNLEMTTPIDLFPHTYHIESVSRLTLK